MNCNLCLSPFNQVENLPKILPCIGVSCLKCLKNMPCIKNEYLIDCVHCSKTHLIANIHDLPTSEITLHLASQNKSPNLKEFSEDLEYYLRSENYDIYKHYDDVICDIDIKAETLIQFIQASRDQLQAKAKKNLENTLAILDIESKADESMDTETQQIINIKNKLINFDETKPSDIELIINESHRLQNYLKDLNKNLYHFSENSTNIDNSLLGHNLNSRFDANYKKIVKLDELFKTADDASKIKLGCLFNELSTRKEIFSFENKYVKMYFTCKRTILFEEFDLCGKLIKTVEHFEDISSFPTSSAYGNYLLIGFSSSHVNYVHLLDSDLKVVRTKKIRNLAESCYLNDKNIVLFYENRVNDCCDLFDCQLNLITSFGQQTNEEQPFYMKKSIVCNPEEKRFGFKLNPKIFGMNDNYLYMSNYNKVSIMNRLTGKEVKKIDLCGFRPYFLMDLQNNILQVNTLEKRLAIYNSELELLAENVYDDEYDCVHINPENKLVFLGTEKKSLIVV
jgi:hypothetical protein